MDKAQVLELLYSEYDASLNDLRRIADNRDYSYGGEYEFNAAMDRVKKAHNQIYGVETGVLDLEAVDLGLGVALDTMPEALEALARGFCPHCHVELVIEQADGSKVCPVCYHTYEVIGGAA